jgi:hypothetical protein
MVKLPNSSFNRKVQIMNPVGQPIDAIFNLTYIVRYKIDLEFQEPFTAWIDFGMVRYNVRRNWKESGYEKRCRNQQTKSTEFYA